MTFVFKIFIQISVSAGSSSFQVHNRGTEGPTSQQAGPSDQQLEVELVGHRVGGWAGEDEVGTPQLGAQGRLRLARGPAETTGPPEGTQGTVRTAV